jgi:hypothetical protein
MQLRSTAAVWCEGKVPMRPVRDTRVERRRTTFVAGEGRQFWRNETSAHWFSGLDSGLPRWHESIAEEMQHDESPIDSNLTIERPSSAGAERDGALLVALCAIAIPFLYLAEHAGKTVTLFAYDWASNKFYQSPATRQL